MSSGTRRRITARGLGAISGLILGVSASAVWSQDFTAPPLVAPPAQRMPTNVIEMIQALGIWAIPFIVLSLVTLWSAVDRFVILRRARVIPKPFVRKLLALVEAGEIGRDEALHVCLQNGSPIAEIFVHGIRKWGKPSVEVEQAIIDGGERQVAALRAHLRVLSGTYTVGPLFGLLGTVWGMLVSFERIANAGAMGNSQQLAGGIALALVTTAAGLAVAIPAIILYMYFIGRVDALVMEMDDLSQRLVRSISAEGLSDRTTRVKRPSRDAESQEPAATGATTTPRKRPV